MRHFNLSIALSILALTASCICTTLSGQRGNIAAMVIFIIAGCLSVLFILSRIRGLIRMMTVCARSMESTDSTFRFPSSDDSELREMSEAMNRIMALYRHSSMELETRKLYYDRILRVMTHEMRNAITPVISVSEDITAHPSRYSDSATLGEAVALINSQSRDISRFLDSYYTLTHLPAPGLERIELSKFFLEIKKLLQPVISANHLAEDTVIYTIPEELTVMADRGLLRQAIVNITKNALEAVAGTAAPKVHILASISENQLFISVSDNGPGIDSSASSMLFQPFFTTKPSGTGIGLCLSRQIAMLHGGNLTVGVSPCGGATFSILLPRRREP